MTLHVGHACQPCSNPGVPTQQSSATTLPRTKKGHHSPLRLQRTGWLWTLVMDASLVPGLVSISKSGLSWVSELLPSLQSLSPRSIKMWRQKMSVSERRAAVKQRTSPASPFPTADVAGQMHAPPAAIFRTQDSYTHFFSLWRAFCIRIKSCQC